MKNRYVLMDEVNAGDQGGAAGGGDAAAAAAAAAAAGGGSNKAWYEDFKDPAVKEWVGSFKDAYPNAEAMALKALNMEKFLGADKAGRGVIIPKQDAKPEEWGAFWKKLGAPEKPEGYQMPKELDGNPLAVKFRDAMHKAGMPPAMFQAVMNYQMTEAKGAAEQSAAAFAAKADKEYNEVIGAWGAEADANVELGRRAAKAFIPHKDAAELETILNRIEGALGTGFTMRLWAAIGKGMGEHAYVDGEGHGAHGDTMSPEAARLRITALKSDVEWMKKFTAGGADEKAEWSKLHRIGFPEQAQ